MRLGFLPAAAVATLAAVTFPFRVAADGVGPIRVEDATAASGITFVLDHAPTPEKRLIETMPGGLAAFDYNGDGRVDLYFTNGAGGDAAGKTPPRFWNRLYRNDGGMRFTDVQEEYLKRR